jgi:amino acid transporter
MSSYTGTPVNVVWYDAILSLVLGLLVFASPQAINAVFSMSVTAVYIAYAIPIVVRFTGGNEFRPGPFYLGRFVRQIFFISLMSNYYIAFSEY